jgi:hypothetical protein
MLDTLFENVDDAATVQVTQKSTKRRRSQKRPKPRKYPRDKDIALWLKSNAPLSFQQLADLRYCLYHRCGRADFTVNKRDEDEFTLTGRQSSVRIINNQARHYLLWRLRLLGRRKKWIGALPRTKASLRRLQSAEWPA